MRGPRPALLDPRAARARPSRRRARGRRAGPRSRRPRPRPTGARTTCPVTPSWTASGAPPEVPGHHRPAAGGRLQEHHAEPLDVQAAPGGCGTAWRRRRRPRSARAARPGGTGPVRTHGPLEPAGAATARRSDASAGPAADEQQRARPGCRASTRGQPATSTSWPLRGDQPGHADDHRARRRARAAAGRRRRRRPG